MVPIGRLSLKTFLLDALYLVAELAAGGGR